MDDPHDDDNQCTKYKKLNINIISGNIELGTFVKGVAVYQIEPPYNQIEFELNSNKAKKFNVILSNSGSTLTSNGVTITTEWRYSTDYGVNDAKFTNGTNYFFWNKMILGCFVTSISIPSGAGSGTVSFEQVLTVYPSSL